MEKLWGKELFVGLNRCWWGSDSHRGVLSRIPNASLAQGSSWASGRASQGEQKGKSSHRVFHPNSCSPIPNPLNKLGNQFYSKSLQVSYLPKWGCRVCSSHSRTLDHGDSCSSLALRMESQVGHCLWPLRFPEQPEASVGLSKSIIVAKWNRKRDRGKQNK